MDAGVKIWGLLARRQPVDDGVKRCGSLGWQFHGSLAIAGCMRTSTPPPPKWRPRPVWWSRADTSCAWSFVHECKHSLLTCEAPLVRAEDTPARHSHKQSYVYKSVPATHTHARTVSHTHTLRIGPDPQAGKVEAC